MALYDTDQNTTNKAAFPDAFGEQDSNTDFADQYRDALTGFISMYQHRLVKHMSEKGDDGNYLISPADVRALAKEATPFGDIQINDPKAIKAMVQSAIQTACVGAARVLNAHVSKNFMNVEKEKLMGVINGEKQCAYYKRCFKIL